MSKALYALGGLRFWNEAEIRFREQLIDDLSYLVKENLTKKNPAWNFFRVEGPCLSPRSQISQSYDNDDIFVTNHDTAGDFLCLRAETTPSSYAWARYHQVNDKRAKPPFCVWQAGKSFRRETSDGATAAKLRFNEFYQLEFQCIYSKTTMADYRTGLMDEICEYLYQRIGSKDRVIDSDRLPSYSTSTMDIELEYDGAWKEVASCSMRTDYNDDLHVMEIAIGLDRLVEIWVHNQEEED